MPTNLQVAEVRAIYMTIGVTACHPSHKGQLVLIWTCRLASIPRISHHGLAPFFGTIVHVTRVKV